MSSKGNDRTLQTKFDCNMWKVMSVELGGLDLQLILCIHHEHKQFHLVPLQHLSSHHEATSYTNNKGKPTI